VDCAVKEKMRISRIRGIGGHDGMPGVYGNSWLHLPTDWLVALATSDLRLWAYGLRAVYGTTRFVHLLAMSGFLGLLLLLEVLRLGAFPGVTAAPVRRPLLTLMNGAFAVAVASGVLLFLYDPIGVGLHTMFLPKLLLVAFGLVHALYVERIALMRRPRWRRASAAAALAIWALVIACSTWNAVERPLNPADIHRADPRAG
jgi:hypothetical protein